MQPWRRVCPEGLEVRPCSGADVVKGNGLFTTRALEEDTGLSMAFVHLHRCCFGQEIDGTDFSGGLIIYQAIYFP